MESKRSLARAFAMGPYQSGLAPPCLAALALALLSCAGRPFPGMGAGGAEAPVAIEYRLASFSGGSLPMTLDGLLPTDCLGEKETQSLEYVYPSGRRVPVEVSTERGFALAVREGELALHEMPLDDGLQVAALADLRVTERQMRKAEKFRAKHATCELAVFVEGDLVDLLVGAKSWEKGLPVGRFPTLDQARAIFQREGISITVVPEALEVTRWRRDFRRWKASQLRWSFRCDASFRETMRRKYPDTYAQLESEDHLFVLSCSKRPKPPQRPVP